MLAFSFAVAEDFSTDAMRWATLETHLLAGVRGAGVIGGVATRRGSLDGSGEVLLKAGGGGGGGRCGAFRSRSYSAMLAPLFGRGGSLTWEE